MIQSIVVPLYYNSIYNSLVFNGHAFCKYNFFVCWYIETVKKWNFILEQICFAPEAYSILRPVDSILILDDSSTSQRERSMPGIHHIKSSLNHTYLKFRFGILLFLFGTYKRNLRVTGNKKSWCIPIQRWLFVTYFDIAVHFLWPF